ncbi:SDR family NAD(P)-dependent oxidoreductase [Clostridium sp.]|uniref:SDR family NAD(P)-dependent oxidoreductase n=1 Tax=Clostridium sp. TaxID=1506 RepID=UPI00261A50A4|nr:SDR family NAD(P)-dependent oxidoreductase [Clostridium sp.]
MTDLYKYIFENTSQNKIDKEVAINIIKKLKEDESKVDIKEDIAITGIAMEFPKADNMEKWWDVLRKGTDCIRPFPINRKQDLNKYLGMEKTNFYSGAYLNEIDNFDYSFFSISPKEASLMDPYQRFILQKAWQVIEDAGYKPEDLNGSRTGVYIGHSNDFGEEYKTIVETLEEESKLSTTGNIHSIIASRICHILNLKGPSLLVDTACSSSLVAVHLACRAIKNKECTMAIAGGVKLNILPVYKDSGQRTGIESSTERTCTFDDSADGTGLGEGGALIFLKPLKKAIQDRDIIYAVIKGSAINQDGNSIGITAPNAKAQEEVIIRAWKEAEINPETIDYIEAHGTGTKLGDPIEIDGITKAFNRYTNKKQFCGIGSLKTNIGHLDNASGIAGLIKVVMSLNRHKVPPSINFKVPNRNIDFQNSPVYINDRLTEWEASSHPRRCGISSFGLSGTNCHMILEEAPIYNVINSVNNNNNIFKLSAKSYESLNQMLIEYRELLSINKDIKIQDLCFTANTRRGDYDLRLAIIVEDIDDLKLKINNILSLGVKNIQDSKIYFKENDHMSNKLEYSDKLKSLDDLASIYIDGYKINWCDYYDNSYNLVKIPTYQFRKSRCWIRKEDITHPFLRGDYLESEDKEIYSCLFSAKNQWAVDEHMVYGKNVPPGTIYVEIACEIGKKHFESNPFEIKDITFLAPMIFEKDEVREVKVTLKKSNETLDFNIESKSYTEDEWINHAVGRLGKLEKDTSVKVIDIDSLKTKYTQKINNEDNENLEGYIGLSDRWRAIKEIYHNEDSTLAYIALDEKYYEDSNDFNFHPVLLDVAVNVLMRDAGDKLYLPFSYKNLKIYRKMPNRFYSILKSNNTIKKNSEAIPYNVTLVDENGKIFAEVENYSIKIVHKNENEFKNKMEIERLIHKIEWCKGIALNKNLKNKKTCIILFKNYNSRITDIINLLEENECKIIKAQLGKKFEKIKNNEYLVGNTEEDFLTLFNDIEKESKFTTIINALNLEEFVGSINEEDLKEKINYKIVNLLHIAKVLVNNNLGDKELLLLTENAYSITGNEKFINPLNASVQGFAKVIYQEYENIKVKCIDITDDTKKEIIVNEIIYMDEYKLVAIRDDYRFIQKLVTNNKIELPKEIENKTEDGTYIITGGTGGIGLEVSRYISLRGKSNICLISRNGFISKDKWDEILINSTDEKLKEKINILKSIEKNGSNIDIYKGDVSVEKEISEIIFNIKNKFKNINGVFHAAGVAGDGFIMRKDKDKFLNVINPKIVGTCLLDKYTKDEDLEAFVLFSSITSKTGGQGQGDYTAANSFLDSYASFRNRNKKNTIVINWAPWKEVGMALDNDAVRHEGPLKAISTIDAIDTLDKIIKNGINDAIVGELNDKFLFDNIDILPFELDTAIKNKLQIEWIKNKKESKASAEEKSKFNVVLLGKNQEYTNTENVISTIVGNVIGLRKININETFKNMGIDSIIASIIVKDIDKKIPDVVSIADFYTYSNVSQLAGYIDKKGNKTIGHIEKHEDSNTDLRDMLRALKNNDVSVEDVLESL